MTTNTKTIYMGTTKMAYWNIMANMPDDGNGQSSNRQKVAK